MATITQTLKTLTFTARAPHKAQKQEVKPVSATFCPPDCSCRNLEPICPPGCSCKTRSSKTAKLIFNAVGIVVAILATYLIISTDSKLYLVFWVVYSVLRRMMMRSNKYSLLKTKTD